MIRTLKLVAGIAAAAEVLRISRSPDIASQLSSITLIIVIKLKQNQSASESRSNNINVKPTAKSNKSQKMKSPNRNAEGRFFNRLIRFNVNLNNNSRHKTKQNKTKRLGICDHLGLSETDINDRERIPKCVGVSGAYDRFRREKELKTRGERRERVVRRRRRKTPGSLDEIVGNSVGAAADMPFL